MLPGGRYVLVLGRRTGSDPWASRSPKPFSGDPLLESLATEHMARCLVGGEHVSPLPQEPEHPAQEAGLPWQAGATRGRLPRSQTHLKFRKTRGVATGPMGPREEGVRWGVSVPVPGQKT